jgi:hypothetical protein
VIVGVGGIGSQIAQRAQAFGMTVIGVDPKDMLLNPYVGRMVYPEQIDMVPRSADVVFISAPHTPKTEGMIGPRQFELMKTGRAATRGSLALEIRQCGNHIAYSRPVRQRQRTANGAFQGEHRAFRNRRAVGERGG